MRAISVYQSDPIQWRVWLDAGRWDPSLRLVSAEEYQRLQYLIAQYNELQTLLEEIGNRPELEYDDPRATDTTLYGVTVVDPAAKEPGK